MIRILLNRIFVTAIFDFAFTVVTKVLSFSKLYVYERSDLLTFYQSDFQFCICIMMAFRSP